MKFKASLISLVLAFLSLSLLGFAQESRHHGEEQSQAIEVMKKVCEIYRSVYSAKFRGLASVDDFHGDLKTQKNYLIDISIQRPEKFKVVRQGDDAGAVYYNGKTLTVVDSKNNFYSQAERSGDFLTLFAAAEELNLPTPTLDLFLSTNCAKALEKVDGVATLPELTLDGVTVSHYLFKNSTDKIQWEAWIAQNGTRYWLKKIVITSLHLKELPQYSFHLLEENLNPTIDPNEFEFQAPQGANQIDFLAWLPPQQSSDSISLASYPNMDWPAEQARRLALRNYRQKNGYETSRRTYSSYLPKGCRWKSPYYRCGDVLYKPVTESGKTVYCRMN